jgi:membrane fusion protein (multidrug efflux system)
MASSAPDSSPETAAPKGPAQASVPLPPPVRLSPMKRALLGLVGLGVCLWLGQFAFHLWKYEETDDAYAVGHVHQISSEVDGQIAAVLAVENQTVHAGDLLVRLDPLQFNIGAEKAAAAEAQAAADQAQTRSSITQAEAQLTQARAGARQAAAQAEQMRAQLSLAQLTLDRDNRMAQDRAVTPAELDEARARFAAADAAVRAAAANADSVQAGVVSAQARRTAMAAQLNASAAALRLARAAVADAKRQLSYVAITAPADGRVGNKNVEVGNRVQIGQTLMVVVEPEVWFEANFKETQLARIREGQAAEVRVDAIPGQVFHGRVESVAPASGAQFALLPADNATGNFTKVVQRVPVRVVLPPEEVRGFADRIRPGLSAVIAVQVR